jgi:hypothetical protein
MDNVNQPQGNGPQDNPPGQPGRFTPSNWPSESPAYGHPPQGQDPGGPWMAGPGSRQQPGGAPDPYAAYQGDQTDPYAAHAGAPQNDPYPSYAGGQNTPYPPYASGQNAPTQQLPRPGTQRPPRKNGWMQNKKLRWGAGIAAAVLLGAGGTLAGLELTSSGTTAPQSNAASAVALNSALGYSTGCSLSSVTSDPGSAAIKADRANLRRCLRARLRIIPGMYGEVAFHTTNGTETLAFERGEIMSTGGGQLTVQADNGTTWTWQVASSPIIRESGKATTINSLQKGIKVFVGGLDDGTNKDAKLILLHAGKSGSGKSSSHKKSSKSSSSTST